ncbi:Dps family protein [Winogradskyella jejuensis]|uniref:Starvation-inducible DNA-binding protein n=1 Tax=Winogradskyella jejuensis TaxID=1089305 RepID=A0A1M5UX74_9FLAO|nr:Dps family protein [Winogradskyella jejuensis]SHH67539.1 starvation-inducible DNA-binding protein [Winogradskyella jejuensis]
MNDKKLVPVIFGMNVLLADFHMYYQKLRNFHWNISGNNFFTLHNKFEELYNDARVKIDEIAERILTLKYHPISRYSEYLKISNIEEVKTITEAETMIKELKNDQLIIINQIRETIEQADKAADEGTIDLLGAYLREMEKENWMLSAWLEETHQKVDAKMIKA